MQAGRARWRIENETFNTLKNQGYHFEHNFGHGYQHLTTVLMHLMLLAFLMDQIQPRCGGLFQRSSALLAQTARTFQQSLDPRLGDAVSEPGFYTQTTTHRD